MSTVGNFSKAILNLYLITWLHTIKNKHLEKWNFLFQISTSLTDNYSSPTSILSNHCKKIDLLVRIETVNTSIVEFK